MKEMEEYINKSTWRLKENSNTNYSLSGLQSYIAQTNIARKSLNECTAGKLHKDGKIYIHDLGFGLQTPYCCGWDLQMLLRKGLKTFCETTSGPAKHFSTACDHIMNFTYIASGEWAGAQAFSHFDTLLAPFIYYDKLNHDEVKQTIQRTVFNLGYPLKTGYQCPFVNWSFDLTIPKMLKDQPVIIGGEFKKEKYADFQNEVDMINLAFLDVMKEGDYNHRPFTFPIPTYTMTKDFDWNSEVSNSLFELTAKIGLPYFSNQVGNGDMENVYSMCCRLLINMEDLPPRGIWDIGVSTGSTGVITLNMPQLGYLSKTEKQFFNKLDYLLNKIKLQLLEKRELCEKSFKGGLMPFSKQYLPDFKSHFNSVGIIGMEECCQNFLGGSIIENQAFVEKVLTFIVEKLKIFREETGLLWNFEATPAEGASFALARNDKERYEDIITSGVDAPYYTNSTHLPVDCELNLIDQIEIQEKFQTKFTGGTIFHVFHDQHMDVNAAKDLVNKIATNTKLPYFDITPTFSVCEDHGHLPGLQETCPKCGKSCSIFSRVTGYVREIKKWNPGKQEEFKNRKSLI